jgi:hypothetical protein
MPFVIKRRSAVLPFTWTWTLASALALAASCSQKVDHTTLVVHVESELRPPAALDAISVRIRTTATSFKDYTFPLVNQGNAKTYSLPLSFSLTPNGDPSQSFGVDVSGRLADQEIVFRSYQVAGFVPGQSRVLNVLLTAACQGSHCAGGQTCSVAACAFQSVAPTTLPPAGADGGTDAGAGAGGNPDGSIEVGAGGQDAGRDAGGGAGGGAAGMGVAGAGGGAGQGPAGITGTAGAAGAGTAGAPGVPECHLDEKRCGPGEQPQMCGATGMWRNDGAACAAPTPTCDGTTHACVCTKKICGTVCTDLQTDARNCGGCGHDCQEGMCLRGWCQPFAMATGQDRAAGVAVDATNVYWVTGGTGAPGAVMKRRLTGGAPIMLASTPSVADIALDATYVYWLTWINDPTAGANGAIHRIPTTGGAPSLVVPSVSSVATMAVSGSSLFWLDQFGNEVNKVAAQTGGATVTLASNQQRPYGLALDGTNVYWTNIEGGTVMKLSQAGGTPVMMASGQGDSYEIVASGPNLYWVGGYELSLKSTLRMVPITTGTPTPLLTLDGQSYGLVADATNVYWFSALGLRKINVSTSVVTAYGDIADYPSPGQDVAIDATSLYWGANDTVWKMTKP